MFLEISTLCALVFISFICLTVVLIAVSRHRHPHITEPLIYDLPETVEATSQASKETKGESNTFEQCSSGIILELTARSDYVRDEDILLRDLGDLETALKETLTANPVICKTQTEFTSDTNISSQIVVVEKVLEDFARKEDILSDDVGEVLEKCMKHICDIKQAIPFVENVRTSALGEINRSGQIVEEILDTCIKHVIEIKSAMPLFAEVKGDHWDGTNFGISELSEGKRQLIETYELNSDVSASYSSRQVSSEEKDVKENANIFPGVTMSVNHQVQVVNTLQHALPDVSSERTYSHLAYPSTLTHPLLEEIVNGFHTDNICHEVMDLSGNTTIENTKSEVRYPLNVVESCQGKNQDSTKELNNNVQDKVEEWVFRLKNMFVPAAQQKEDHLTDDLHISNDVVNNDQCTDEGLQEALDIPLRYNISEIPISPSASDTTRYMDKKRISRRDSNTELETKVIFTESEEVSDTARKEFTCIEDYLQVSSANETPAQDELDKIESNSSISSIIGESIAQLLDLLNDMDRAARRAKTTPEFHEADVKNCGIRLAETNSDTENEIQEYEVTFDNNSVQESMPKIQLRNSSSMFEMLHLNETMKNVSAINGTESNDEESYNVSEERTGFVKDSRQTRSFVDPQEAKNKVYKDVHQGWSLSFESRRNASAGSQVFRDYWSFRENFQKKIAKILAHQNTSVEIKPETDELISDERVDSSSKSQQNSSSVESSAMTLLTSSDNRKRDVLKNDFTNKNLFGKCVESREQCLKDSMHDIGKRFRQNYDMNEAQNETELAEVTQVGMSSSLNKVLPDTDFNLKHNDSIDLSRKSFEIGLSRAVKSDMLQDSDQKNSVFSLEKHRDSVELLCRRSFDSAKKKSTIDDVTKNTFAQSFGVHRSCLRRSSGSLGNHHDSADLISRRSVESRGNDDEGDKRTALDNVIDSVELLSNKSNGTNNSDSNDNDNERDVAGCEEVRKPHHQVCWDLQGSIDSDVNVCSSGGIQNKSVEKNQTTKKKSIEFRTMHDAHGTNEISEDTSMERLSTHSATSVDGDFLDDNRSAPKSILKLNKARSNVRSVSWKDLKNQNESQLSCRVDESDPCFVLEPKADRSSILEENSEPGSSLVKPGCSSSDVGSLIRLFNGTKAFNEKRNANIEMETGDDFIWDLKHKFQDSDDDARNYSRIAETENPADNNEMLLTCENLSEQLLAMTEKFHNVREHVTRLESYYEGGNGTSEEAEEEKTEVSEK